MEDIHKLTDCINLHFNSGVTIISHKNWKMLEYKQDLLSKSILLFDTKKVGLGEFGERNKEDVTHEKWIDAIGIIQYLENEVVITVIPKGIKYTENSVRPYLRRNNMCMICRSDKVHVKIDNTTGLVICKTCYDKCFGE